MLNHESIFTFQVQELHRLYKRQRELMNDIKKRELRHREKQLNVCSSQLESESAQKESNIPSLPWIKTILCGPSSSFAAGKSTQACSSSPLTETNSKQFELFSFKRKKSGKRILDLELPADEYIDSEEDSLVRKSNDLVDLNIGPIQVEGNDLYCDNCSRIVNSCLCTSHQLAPMSYVAKSEPYLVSYERKPFAKFQHIPVEVQALPSFKYPAPLSWSSKLFAGNHGLDVHKFHINKNSANSSTVENVGFSQNSLFLGCKKEKLEDSILVIPWVRRANPAYNEEPNKESVCSQAFPTFSCNVDLMRHGNSDCQSSSTSKSHPKSFEDKEIDNSDKLGIVGVGCVRENESVLKSSVHSAVIKTTMEINLEGPLSPENKECSPPRGESEEQLNASIQPSKQEDTDPQANFAAEVLVLISTSATFSPSEASSDRLLWFAGVVSSVKCHLENDFEELTSKLEEIKVDDYSSKSKSKTSKRKAAGAMSLPNKHKKGRARRVIQKKDFQTYILPSLASLSRHEAKEDLQLFRGLLEAAGTPLGTGSKRKNATKNGSSSWKRKQQTNGKELKFLEECLTGWGKINKRRRKNRVPASNPSLTFRMGGIMGK